MKKIYLVLISTLLGALISILILRNGLWATPDSWGYWEASISLIERGGYTYLDSRPIMAWPPVYALYLSLFQFVFGQTGLAIIYSMLVLVAANILVWSFYVLVISPPLSTSILKYSLFSSILFISIFIPTQFIQPLANCLFTFWVGCIALILALIYKWNLFNIWILSSLILCISAMLLTHNSGIIFLPAVGFVLYSKLKYRFFKKISIAGGILFFPLILWYLVRKALGQLGTHILGPPPQNNFSGYLLESIYGFGIYFGEYIGRSRINVDTLNIALYAIGVIFVSLVLKCLMSAWKSKNFGFIMPIGMAISAYFILLGIFCLTPIYDQFWGRFLWFVPLLSIPIIFYQTAHTTKIFGYIIPLLIILLQLQAARVLIPTGVVARKDFCEISQLETWQIIRPEFLLSSNLESDNNITNFLRIEPPTFPWHWRWNAEKNHPEQNSVKVFR